MTDILNVVFERMGVSPSVMRGIWGEKDFSIEWVDIENPPTMDELEEECAKVKAELVLEKSELINQAKILIGILLVEHVGKLTDQHNAMVTIIGIQNGAKIADDFDLEDWKRRLALRDAIKYKHGAELKEAIRSATTLARLESIAATMTKDYENWAK